MNTDEHSSTPGVWQDDMFVIVLAHVVRCWWGKVSPAYPTTGENVACEHANASFFAIDHVSCIGHPTQTLLTKTQGESFVRALNLYWEIATRR